MKPFKTLIPPTKSPTLSTRRCDGDCSPAGDPWPLHHVGRRGNFRLLCTSCLLLHHRPFFCSICLDLLDSPPPPSGELSAGISRCRRCPSAAHSSCLPHKISPFDYLCHICDRPESSSYFPLVADNAIGEPAARALLSAARIAAASMSRAAAAARLEAERKLKMAAVARKTAKEMVERVMAISCGKRKEEMEEVEGKRVGGVKVKKKKKKRRKKKKMVIGLSSPSGLLKKS